MTRARFCVRCWHELTPTTEFVHGGHNQTGHHDHTASLCVQCVVHPQPVDPVRAAVNQYIAEQPVEDPGVIRDRQLFLATMPSSPGRHRPKEQQP